MVSQGLYVVHICLSSLTRSLTNMLVFGAPSVVYCSNKEFCSSLPEAVRDALQRFRLAEADHERAHIAADSAAIETTSKSLSFEAKNLGRTAAR